jgi:two-component system, NtrC family, sensor histidine kinase PilS
MIQPPATARTPRDPSLAVVTSISPPRAKLQQAMTDPRRIMRGVYVGRFIVSAAIFLAAQAVWERTPTEDARLATLIFVVSLLFTVASASYTEVVHTTTPPRTFFYIQTAFDVALVTAIVHVTGGSLSPFVWFYILVIACAALLLPVGAGLLTAFACNVCYFAEVLWLSRTAVDLSVWLQLLVFGSVAVGSGYIGSRLQQAGAGTAAELVLVRLQAEDILRNIRSGILTIDARGYLLYANAAAIELLGLPARRSMGGPILPLIASVAPRLALALEEAATQNVRTTRGEDTVTLRGRAFPIGVTTTFSDGDGSPGSATATAIFQDISGQKRLESLHVRAGRLEAVAELGASLAHEIKNPLASIRSAVEQLAGMPQADDDARTLGALIVRESDRLSRLLTEFLDFARVRVARLRPVDVGQIAAGAAGLVSAHPDRQPGVVVTCSIPETPLVIDGDEDLLHRAVFNLALNAAQATSATGAVRIDVAAVAADQLPSGVTFDRGAVALRVSDDGPGIAPEVRDRLFEPFMTTKSGGSGLGLSVVHRAIEAHRGLVLVDTGSTGTRFTVLLPYSQTEDAP